MKFFNTSGPVNVEKHYFVSNRLNENILHQLIAQEKYFVLHAPRQSGKTTAIKSFVKKLNEEGLYKALYVNIEAAQAARSNVIDGLRTILDKFKTALSIDLPENDPILSYLQRESNNPTLSGNSLEACLQFLTQNFDKPVILFIDEIDSLVGDTLISVLRQLRAGYTNRPQAFPQSVCLIGVRDVRDYRIWSDSQQQSILGGSAFNIKAESLTLPDFSFEQVKDLYLQHTKETGQKFTDDAIEYAFEQTQGQPWLVNALAYQACFRDVTNRSTTITKEIIERAKEALIVRRDTHIDVLVDRLSEPRVRTIIDEVVSGSGETSDFKTDDLQYVRDLGLIGPKGICIANPIYQEIIPRELTYTKQESMNVQPLWYKKPDGTIDTIKLLNAFSQFYREHSDIWLEKFAYKEAGPHLLLMAFLQRVINGGGKIHREYALGRKRLDIFISYPLTPVTPAQEQRIVIELKVKRNEKTREEGLQQTAEYMDTNNATEGHLVIFDRNPGKSWDEKIYHEQEQVGSKTIDVWGM